MLPCVLFKAEAQLIISHLIALDPEGKRMRFGGTLSDSSIENYVNRSFDSPDVMWYGYLVQGECVGCIHIHIENNTSELGISISDEYRGVGLSNSLFSRAVTYLKSKGCTTAIMQCLSENAAMQHIAKKHGMKVVTVGPGEKVGSINIDVGNPVVSSIKNLNSDVLALIDGNVRNQYWLFNSLSSIFKKGFK